MKILVLLIHLLQFGDSTEAPKFEEQVFRGVYIGTNLFIYNPAPDKGECIFAIKVNGKTVPFAVKSAIEVDLTGFQPNEALEIRVIHELGCQPKLLNPKALTSSLDFQFNYTAISETAFTWYTHGETKGSRYFVEVFRNNFWKVEKAIASRGQEEEQSYNAEIAHLPGKNKYRIKYLDNTTGKVHYSREMEYLSEKKVAWHSFPKITEIEFSEPLTYEIRDSKDQLITKGTADRVDCSQLVEGSYFVIYQNRTARFDKQNGKLQPPPANAAAMGKVREKNGDPQALITNNPK